MMLVYATTARLLRPRVSASTSLLAIQLASLSPRHHRHHHHLHQHAYQNISLPLLSPFFDRSHSVRREHPEPRHVSCSPSWHTSFALPPQRPKSKARSPEKPPVDAKKEALALFDDFDDDMGAQDDADMAAILASVNETPEQR